MPPQGTTVTRGCERSRVTGCKTKVIRIFHYNEMQHRFHFIINGIIIKVFDYETTFIHALVLWIKGPTLTLNF